MVSEVPPSSQTDQVGVNGGLDDSNSEQQWLILTKHLALFNLPFTWGSEQFPACLRGHTARGVLDLVPASGACVLALVSFSDSFQGSSKQTGREHKPPQLVWPTEDAKCMFVPLSFTRL